MNQSIELPDTCPQCGSGVNAVRYKEGLRLLKNRSWRVCTNQKCDFQETNDNFHQRMGFGLP